MINFLIKSWVYPFYKTYAGFLFVVFLFAVGLLRGEEHIRLAYFFTSHISNLVYPLFIFLLYESLSLHFSLKWLSFQKNSMIRSLIFLGYYQRKIILLSILMYLQVPVVIYSLFLSGIVLISGNIQVFLTILTAFILRILIYVYLIEKILIHPHEKVYKSYRNLKPLISIGFPLLNFSLKLIFTQKFLSFALSKIISIGTLYILVNLIETVDHYERFTSFVIFWVFLANAFISFELFRFHHIQMNNFRSLPVNPWILILQTLLTILVLTLPEIVIIYRNYLSLVSFLFIAEQIVLGLLVLLFLYAYLIFYNIDLTNFIIRIFWGSLIMVVFLLFDIPSWILMMLLFSGIYYLYSKGYYRFELVFDQIN